MELLDDILIENAQCLKLAEIYSNILTGLMDARDFASPSTPVVGTPFWHAVS